MDKSKMKADNGRFKTVGLFVEPSYNYDEAIYTKKEDDLVHEGKTYPSLYKLYMEASDPTEYKFAQEHLLGWSHWKELSGSSGLKDMVAGWREELEVKLRSEGVLKMIELATDSPSAATTRWLAEAGFIDKAVGRPTNKKIKEEAAKQVKSHSGAVADLERMRALRDK